MKVLELELQVRQTFNIQYLIGKKGSLLFMDNLPLNFLIEGNPNSVSGTSIMCNHVGYT